MLDQLANGILLGAIIAITSVGLSLVFSVTRAFNFAHGDMVALGAMLMVLVTQGLGLPVWAGVLVVVPVGALFGGVLDVALFRPMRRAGVGGITMLVATLGLSLLLRYGMLAIAGPEPRARPLPSQRVHSVLGMGFTPMSMLVIVATVVLLALFGVFLNRSTLGTTMRAVANNRALASASGIDVQRTMLATWTISGGLAAVGGVMLGLTQLVYWDMGFQLLLLIFAGVIAGGLGTAYGAMAGGFFIGVVTQLSVAMPYVRDHVDLKLAVALSVMIVVLLVRPQGLLGRRVRVS
jgi:branched-chain amino acid transport system permease protein